MNKKSVQQFLKDYDAVLREQLNISDRHIHYEYVKNALYRATTLTDFPYKEITITINPSKIRDEQDLITTLCHEYAHVLLAPFTHYSEKVNKRIRKSLATVFDEHISLMEEIVATDLERIFVRWVSI